MTIRMSGYEITAPPRPSSRSGVGKFHEPAVLHLPSSRHFKKICGKRWSWISPNQEYKTLIDYVITQKSNNSIVDFNINTNFNFHSDRRLLTTKIEITNPHNYNPFHKKNHQRNQPPKISERNHRANRNNRKELNKRRPSRMAL